MPTCFVPGCTSGFKSNPQKRHYFAPPRDPQLLGRWTRAIPRADKVLTKTCKVCDVHFQEADIVKTYKHVINGETVEIDRETWALKSDAVPCLSPNRPSYLSSQRKKRRSPRKKGPRRLKTNSLCLEIDRQISRCSREGLRFCKYFGE